MVGETAEGEPIVDKERAETEAEWARSKRIEEARMQAERAIHEAKPDANALSNIDPRYVDKPKGWSTDSRLVNEKAEKLGMWAAVLAPVGVVSMIISDFGSVVSQTGGLGMFGMMFSIFSAVGSLCLIGAVFFGLISFVTAVYYRVKLGRKLDIAGWSGGAAIAIALVYWLIRSLLLRI